MTDIVDHLMVVNVEVETYEMLKPNSDLSETKTTGALVVTAVGSDIAEITFRIPRGLIRGAPADATFIVRLEQE